MTTAVLERIPDVELERKLIALDQTMKAHPRLEIDSDYEEGGQCYLKILKHPAPDNSSIKGVAYGVPLETIKETPTEELIEALETGVFVKLYGVTRIVGYYSRISNWNKSKLGELQDRHRGNYSVGAVA